MAGAAIQVTIDDTAFRAALARAANLGDDVLHPAWDAIGEAMVSKTIMRFQEQHGPDGAPWLPSKAALKEKRKTLIKTARLMGSMVWNVLPGGGVEWGTNVIYAAVHQFGATFNIFARSQRIYRRVNKKGELGTRFVKKSKSNFASWITLGEHSVGIPARPFLGVDAEDLAESEATLTRHVERAIVAGGKGLTG